MSIFDYRASIAQIRRDSVTEARIRALDAGDIVQEIHSLEDEIISQAEEIAALKEENEKIHAELIARGEAISKLEKEIKIGVAFQEAADSRIDTLQAENAKLKAELAKAKYVVLNTWIVDCYLKAAPGKAREMAEARYKREIAQEDV